MSAPPPWASRRTAIDTAAARTVALVSVLVALALGIQSVAADVSPTWSVTTDFVVVALFAGSVAWAGASAPWWAITALGGVAAVTTGVSLATVPALVAVAVGIALGRIRPDLPWLRVAATGCALLALMRVSVDPFFGASALLVGLVTTAFMVVAIRRRQPWVRRRVLWTVVTTAALAVLATLGLGVGGVQARNDLEAGRDHLTEGLDLLRAGDRGAAAVSLRAAASELARANDAVGAVWTQPSRLVPVIAHHRAVLVDIVDNAASSALAAADALDAADIDQLRVVGGAVDVDALAALEGPLNELDAAVERMTGVLRESNSPWLIGTVQHELSNGLVDIEQSATQVRATAAAATNGPAMLGADGPRRYLIAFTSPGQARGQSGSLVNWAEITITDGTIRQTGFGRTDDLIAGLTSPGSTASEPSDLVLDVTPEYISRYGSSGAGDADTGVLPTYWTNVTMSPDTPTVAAVMAQMYEASGHRTVDGVFVMDASGLAALLRVAGPVTVEGFDQEITADTLEQFLLFDQYRVDDADRRDVLELVAGLTLRQFLTATLPEPQEFAEALGPAATEGHISGWARRPDEQELFRLIGMAGVLPPPEGRDGLAVVTDNAGGNQIDAFLERTVSYSATYDPDDGRTEGELVVTLHNTAPSAGYPESVIGNDAGLPAGTNRSTLTVYSPLAAQGVTIGDEAVSVTSATEGGWNTTSVPVDLAAGETVSVRFELAGEVSADGYAFVWRPQPLAVPDQIAVDVRSADGESEASVTGELPRLTVVDRDGTESLR